MVICQQIKCTPSTRMVTQEGRYTFVINVNENIKLILHTTLEHWLSVLDKVPCVIWNISDQNQEHGSMLYNQK